MKHRISRAVAATVGLGLAVAPVTTALASSTYGSGASTNAVVLQLLDQLTVELAETTSALESSPLGDAAGIAVTIADQTFGATSASSSGAATQEPASDAEQCLTPDLGIAGLDLLGVCSVSRAAASPMPLGTAATSILDTSVNGSLVPDLVDAIVDMLTGTLGVSLDDAVATVTSATGPVLEPVIAQLEAACDAVLGDADLGDVATELDGVIGTLGNSLPDEVATAVDPVAQAIIDAIGADSVCTVLTDLLGSLPEIGSLVDALADALRELLAGLDLLHVGVGGAFSDSTSDQDTVVSEASLTGLTLSTLSLADIQGVVDSAIGAIVGLVVSQLEPIVGDVLPSDFADVVLGDLIAVLEAGLPVGLDLLDLSDDPILSLSVTPTSAMAVLDRATGEVTSSGAAPIATIDLSDSLALLLGENTSFQVEPGMDPVVLLAGTPLETILGVGQVTTFTDEVDGMPVAGATASSVDLVIGTGLPGGGIHLVGGASTAQVAGIDVAPAQPTEEPTLPRTGGGLALLGLVTMAGFAMRRR
ncbi:MAG: hypothetical protein R3249_02100 [Nitriliruptorales bacterium]|nr:hypothetical protein [Nitriliruptorales bacterium]